MSDVQSQQFDFVAVGDVTTDVFIRIQQASVHTDNAAEGEQLCFLNGAKIPYEFARELPAVGNSANAAVSAARLGLRAALVSNVGDDAHGAQDIAALTRAGVDARFIEIHGGKASNYHYVLWYRSERTILIRHEAYAYRMPDVGEPRWLYFSSVGENSLEFHHELVRYLQAHPGTKLAFQPGTYQIKIGYEALKDVYEASELFFCNTDEARLILKDNEPDAAKLPKRISSLGPKISVITDGPNGAYVYDGAYTYFMPVYPDIAPPYERTGAGDAFASTFTSAIALGKAVEEAMRWAPVNSMSVVQKIGAQEGLLSGEEIAAYLAKAPAAYAPQIRTL